MKKIILIALLVITQITQAQTTDNLSLKAGFIGLWGGYEKAVTEKITVVGEIGYIGGFYNNQYLENSRSSIFTLTLGLEGRYYYNFERRIEKGKNTHNNAANYFSIDAVYIPDLLTTPNNDNINVLKTFNVFAKYGIKRNISNNINYEIAFGPGYQWGEDNINSSTFGLDIKFAYVF